MRLRCLVVSFAISETTRQHWYESNAGPVGSMPVHPRSFELSEMAVHRSLTIRLDSRGDQKTQDQRAGDQPE